MFRASVLSFSFLLGSMAHAHEFDSLEVANWSVVRSFVQINIDNTVKGESLVCALYADEDLITSDTQYTDTLATRVLVNHNDRGSEVTRVVCVLDE